MNGAVSKTVVPSGYRGFESHPLRIRMGNKVRLFLAGVLARPRLVPLASRPRPPAEARQERLFGRPFQYLVANAGVLVPVTVAVRDGWDAAAAAAERAALEAEALARRN